MKRLITILAVLVVVCLTTAIAEADVYVRGYFRSNGTYVRPHYRSNPDGNFWNNWSTYPNVNPYTGAIGTRRTPSYSSGYSWRTPTYSYPSYSYPSYSYPSYSFPSYSYPSYSYPSYSYPSYNSFGGSLWGW